MKINRLLNLVVAMLLLAVTATAQDVNKLYLSEMTGMKNRSLDMPVYLENTSSRIVAFQFDVKTPDGVTLKTSGNKADETRATDHKVNVRQLSDGTYRVMMLSPTNKTVRANRGSVASIVASISDSAPLEENGVYPIILSNVVISDSLGNNVMTSFENGTLRIGANPDFVIENVELNGASTVSPNDSVAISWSVKNCGAADALGGFREQVSLVSTVTGEYVNLGTVYHNDVLLAAGTSQSVTHKFLVPRLVGLDGTFQVKVVLTPNSDSGERREYQGNNTTLSDEAQEYTMNKVLYITNRTSITETDKESRYTYYVERSGSRAEQMNFSVNLTGGDSRLSLSADEVMINKNAQSAYVYLYVAGNTTLEKDVEFAVEIPAANGYAAMQSAGKLFDNEEPEFIFTSSKEEVNEGETFTMTLTATIEQEEDVKIKLVNTKPSLFNMPLSVVLPAGETSVTFDVVATEDDVVTGLSDVLFTAMATGFKNQECWVDVADNDMPSLTMTLTPTIISEAAGPSAIVGVITRDKTNSDIIIQLSDDGGEDLYYSPKRFTLKKGQSRVEFTIGVVDNQMKEGDRNIEFTAAIYIANCNCMAGAMSGGYIADTIHVIDNDGPALAIKSKNGNILEGSDNNVFTISRNDSPASDLTVQVSSTGEGLTYAQTITIPAGKTSVDFNVAMARNDVSGDSKTITFKVSSDGYANGTCWVMSTDQTLPDASITSMNILTSDSYAGDSIEVEMEIYNGGYADLKLAMPIDITHGNKKTTIYLKHTVKPGESYVQTDKIPTTTIAGTYHLEAVCDNANIIKEISDANNRSPRCTLVLSPLFRATAKTDKARYSNNEEVVITGKVEGLYSRNAEVEVYVVSDAKRDTIMTRTDDNGNYIARWTPVGNQAGSFGVGACTVGENLTKRMATFDVCGMRRYDKGFILNEIEVGETKENFVHLYNHGTIDLTDITVTAEYNNTTAQFEFGSIDRLAAGENARVVFSVKGLAPSEGKDWELVNIKFESAEGAVFEQVAYFYVRSAVPVLEADITEINTTMVKGSTRNYEVTISNKGRKETGEITVELPETGWLRTATPVKMASLAQDESAVIVLQMTPTAEQELNSINNGNFVVSAANGSSISVRYRVETVSEATGTLVIDVWDEFTYNTEEAPHVEGATVNVLHPVTQKLLRQYVTGADGLATFEKLPEGKYIVKVTHPKHSSWSDNVLVSPERTTTRIAFIQYSAISVEMVYEPTEIEDEYQIVTTVKYETNVPKPVVVLDLPDKIILDSIQTPYIFYATMTNVGLITAFESRFAITDSINNSYTFTPLIEGPWDILPHQTIIIPVEINKIAQPQLANGRRANARNIVAALRCGAEAFGSFFDKCGGTSNNPEQAVSDMMQTSQACGEGALGFGGGIPTQSKPGEPGSVSGAPLQTSDGESGGGGGGGRDMVSCDPWLQANGPGVINGLVGSASPALGAGMAAASAAEGDPIPALVSGATAGLSAAGKPFIAAAVETGNMANGLFNPSSAPARRFNTEEYARFMARTRSVLSEEDTEDLEALVSEQFEVEMSDMSQSMKKLYCSLIAMNKRTERFDEEPLWFSNSAFNEERPLNDTIASELPHWYPSWLSAWANNVQIPLYSTYHWLMFMHELFGDWGFVLIDEDELSALTNALNRAYSETDGLLTLDDMPKSESFCAEARTRLCERLNNTIKMTRDVQVEGDNYVRHDIIVQCNDRINEANREAQRLGYEDVAEMYETEKQELLDILTDERTSSCATVKLQIEQKLTMTRQAVRGTLTVNNPSESAAMKDIKLNLVVTDPYGNIADAHIMEIHTEEKSGFTGEDDFESGWNLPAKTTGVAKILFIPTKYAAPTEPLQYTFSGSISFIDPFSGLEMTRELEAERLTVNPSPNLELVYFMQRDIFGDDALTEEVEPIIPAQFTLLINNNGYGDATKVKMLTQQPKIIENEKGLLVDFEIQSSQLNGGDKTLAMGESVATDFGTIPAHSHTYAQWWLTSTLTGHFVEYDVKATHVTSYDNPDLSLLDSVHIHELIHQIEIPWEPSTPKKLGFLVNDEVDMEDYPDALYKTDGTIVPVHIASGATMIALSGTQYELRVYPSATGWNYGNIADPTGGFQELMSVTRKSDGTEIPLANFWLTDRTLVDKMEPVYENLIHYADTMHLAGETYLLTFAPKPAQPLEVKKFSGVPVDDSYTRIPVDTVTVAFNKPIDSATFTTDDIKMLFQGTEVDLASVTITKVNAMTYKLYIGELTSLDGYYTITVNTVGINDEEGLPGYNGKMTGWIQISDGKANLMMEVIPEGAGIVTPGNSKQDFEGEVAITATPNEGYKFLYWTSGNEVLSQDPEAVVSMYGQKTVTAVFQEVKYQVGIIYNSSRGKVTGGATSMFNYNQEVTLKAEALKGYCFKGWKHNEEIISTTPELTFIVKGTDEYEALFEPTELVVVFLDENATDNTSMFEDTYGKRYEITLNRKLSAWQWNPFCVPFDISEQQINKTWGYATMIVRLTKVEDDKMYFTSAYNIKAGVPYLVKPERTVETPYFTYDNNIVVENEPIVTDYDGIQFAGNYTPHEWNPADEYYYGVKSNNIIKAKESTAALKGMRGYFVIPQGRKAMIYIGDNFTGISETVEEKGNSNAGIYNLQGVYLGNDASSLAPGLYIVNGQKCIVK